VNQGERAGKYTTFKWHTFVGHRKKYGTLIGFVWRALYHPDYDRRLWSYTRSADPKRKYL